MFRVIPHRALIEPRAAVTSVAAEGDAARATLRIDGLLCSACAANVRGRLERLDGVSSARIDLDRGEAYVAYDASCVAPTDLVRAVEGAVVLRPLRRLLATISGHTARRRSA